MASSDDSRRASYVNSGSVLLKDMLREKKAQMQRQTSGQRNGLDNRNIQSSPIASMSTRDTRDSSSSARRSNGMGTRSSSGPKEMGLREMEERISQIKNQNFDLKLELFHLRQRNEGLEARLANVATLEADVQEQQSINEELLIELEKRDVVLENKDMALQEAVDYICELERKIEEMGEAETYFMGNARTQKPDLSSQGVSSGSNELDRVPQPSTQEADAGGQAQPGSTSLSRVDASSPTPSKSSRRVPSFLWDTKKSTTILRSMYLHDVSHTQDSRSSISLARPGSLYNGEYDDEDRMLSSPRLSVLSESGFSSIYGSRERSHSPPQHDATHVEQEPTYSNEPPRTNQREARLQKWLAERDRPSTPTQQTPTAVFSSIGQVLEQVPGSSKSQEPEKTQYGEQGSRGERKPDETLKKKSRRHGRKPSSPAFCGPMFGGSALPPTPDTLSTAANSSTPSIVTEKSLLDGAPYRAKGFSNLISDGRPHTSDSSVASTFGTALVYTQSGRPNRSREAQGSPHSPQKNVSSGSHPRESPLPTLPRSSSSRSATRPVRPSLTTSITDTVVYADGYSPTNASRTLSYPSPGSRTNDPSNQLSPVSSQGSNAHSEKTTTVSPRNGAGASSAAGTPSRLTRNMHQCSPTAMRDLSTPSPMVELQSEIFPSPQRSSSLRSRMAKVSLTPNKSAHQSIASRLFRRQNSQGIQTRVNTQTNTPSKPPEVHARLPRPTSLYASGPANARPGTADNDQGAARGSLLPLHIRRHSAALDQAADLWGKGEFGLGHEERESINARQSMRTDEGKKWALGWSTSAKIREGFGFKRSASTQPV